MKKQIAVVSLVAMAAALLWAPGAQAAWVHQDVGAPGLAGDAIGAPPGPITVTGGGNDIWGNSDNFHFAFDNTFVNGDFTAIARLASQTNSDGWAKAGIMARADLTGGSVHVHTSGTISNAISQQWRDTAGEGSGYPGSMAGSPNSDGQPYWIYLARTGDVFDSRWAPADAMGVPGPWSAPTSHTSPNMPANVLLGLSVTAHNDSTTSTAVFEEVNFNAAPVYTGVQGAPGADPGMPAGLSAQVVHTTPGYDPGNADGAIARLGLSPGDDGHYASQVTTVDSAHVHDHGQTANPAALLLQNERSGGGAPVDQYGVRLAGYIQASAGQRLDFMARHDDEMRVNIGTTTVGNLTGSDGGNPAYFNAEFSADGWYPIEIIGQQGGGGVGWELYSRAGGTADPYVIVGAAGGLQVQQRPSGVPAPADRGPNPAGAALSTDPADPADSDGLRVQVVYGAPNFANTAEGVAFLRDPANYSAGTIVKSNTPFDYVDPGYGSDGLFTPNNPFPGETPGTDDNNFAMRINGLVYIPPGGEGDYSVSVGSDDGFQLRVGQNLTAYATDPRGHPGANDTNIGHVRFPTPGLYPFEYYMFENGGGASSEIAFAPYTGLLVQSRDPTTMNFSTNLRGAGAGLFSVEPKARLSADGQDLHGAAYADVPALGAVIRPETWTLLKRVDGAGARQPGLLGEYYTRSGNDPGTFVGRRTDLVPGSPAVTEFFFPNDPGGTDTSFADDPTWGRLEDNFFVRWSGYINLPQSGKYNFRMNTDDVSRIFIDVDGDGVLEAAPGNEAWTVNWNNVELAEGLHEVEFNAVEHSGGDWSRLEWQLPGSASWQTIPADFFSLDIFDDAWLPLAYEHGQLGDDVLDQLLAAGLDPSKSHYFRLITDIAGLRATADLEIGVIPEPATMFLAAMGLAGLGGYIRSSRAKPRGRRRRA